MNLHFTVFGRPIGQARPRFFTRKTKGGKIFSGAYNPQDTEAARFALDVRAQLPVGWQPIKGPVRMDLIFGMPIPSSSKKKHNAMACGLIAPAKKPDISNMIKFVEDSLNGLVFEDDSQICHIEAYKHYSEIPSTKIEITELSQEN
jgi:Holliday junction resolvase RusA-like endonuclease